MGASNWLRHGPLAITVSRAMVAREGSMLMIWEGACRRQRSRWRVVLRDSRGILGLAVEEVGDGHHRDELEGLARVELQFHGLFQNPSSMFLDGFMHGVGGEIKLAGPCDEPLFTVYFLEELWFFQC